ncbi:MAG: hypothetical protein MJ075_01525 [Oscillospiraceae bacterium]|nr:hypothetical protein [Oscillospiraceae bacterium]
MLAAAKPERLLAEDMMHETGCMLPQSNNTHELPEELTASPPVPDSPQLQPKTCWRVFPTTRKKNP